MEYTVKQLAKMAGVSVRTLHYYDEIGLLKPSFVKPNGYRCYRRPELLRLQQVLFFRELGFSLEQIRQVLDSPDFDTRQALMDQKKLLELEKERVDGLLQTIDSTLKELKGEVTMKAQDLYGSFTREQIEEYRQEVIDRWGEKSLLESEAKISAWTPDETRWVEKEAQEVVGGMMACMAAGKAPDDPEAQELAGRYFAYMQKFFDCSVEIFRELGKMYVDDPRFAAYYEKYHPDLAAYMRDSMAAWCDAQNASH